MKKITLLFAVGIAVPAPLILFSVFNPAAIFLFLPILFAFPAIFSQLRYEKTALLYGVVLSFAMYWAFSYFGIVFGLTSAFFGMLAGNDIAEGKSVKASLCKGGLGFVAVIVLSCVLFTKFTGMRISTLWYEIMQSASASLYTLPEKLKMLEAYYPELAQMNDPEMYMPLLEQQLAQTKMLLPALLFMFSAIFGYIVLWIISLLNTIICKKPRFVPHFSRFRCTTTTTWIYFISMFAVYLTDENSVMAYAFANLHAVTSFILLVCAMSFLDFWMKRKHWKGILRFLAICGIAFVSTVSLISLVLTLLAFFDARVNIRGLKD